MSGPPWEYAYDYNTSGCECDGEVGCSSPQCTAKAPLLSGAVAPDPDEAVAAHFGLNEPLMLDVRAKRGMRPPSHLVEELWDLQWAIEQAHAEDTPEAEDDAFAMCGAQHALLWVLGWLPEELAGSPATRWTPGALTMAQLQGLACILCGTTAGEMIPLPGLTSPLSAQLFRCTDACLPEVVG